MSKEQSIIEEALTAVRRELQATPNGTASVLPHEQLLRVECELSDMLEDLHRDRTASDHSGLGRMVVDSWPLQHELTEHVCAAVQAYSSAMESGSS